MILSTFNLVRLGSPAAAVRPVSHEDLRERRRPVLLGRQAGRHRLAGLPHSISLMLISVLNSRVFFCPILELALARSFTRYVMLATPMSRQPFDTNCISVSQTSRPTSETTHLILVLRARIRSPAAHPLPPSPRGSLLKWKFLLRRRQIGARCLIGRRKHRQRPPLLGHSAR